MQFYSLYTYLGGQVPLSVSTVDQATGTPKAASDAYITIFQQSPEEKLVLPRTSDGVTIGADSVVYVVQSPITDSAGTYVGVFEITFSPTDIHPYEVPFAVYDKPRYSDVERLLINGVRLFIRDNKPALYRVDEPVQQYDDEELYAFLYYALLDFNISPPYITYFTFETLPEVCYNVVVVGAVVMSLISRAVLEAGNQFTYNDNGISVTLSRSAAFMSPAQALLTQYTTMKKSIKRAIGFGSSKFKGLKVLRAPYSVRRPLAMLPNLQNLFGRGLI